MKKLTKQELFDKAMTAQIKQAEYALDKEGNCVYINHEGHSCMIGHVLSDSTKKDLLNNGGVFARDALYRDNYNERDDDKLLFFAGNLQRAHDKCSVIGEWNEDVFVSNMKEFAKKENITFNSHLYGLKGE